MSVIGAFVVVMMINVVEVESQGVRASVELKAQVYSYTLMNIDAASIRSVEIDEDRAYNFAVPMGWRCENTPEMFHAWTTDSDLAIGLGQKGVFSFRASNYTGGLGLVQLRVGLESGEQLVLPRLWGPVREPLLSVAVVAGLLSLIVLFHTLLSELRHRPKIVGC